MTIASKPRAIVTDIEGTTSSISFVHDVLFPYSRTRLESYVAEHSVETAGILDQVRAETGDSAMDIAACISQLAEWHDADLKIGPLKTLQGMIWADGFAAGVLKGHIYPDAAAGLRRWHMAGISLYIYSSGSIAAQKLLFGHTEYGDLTPIFSGHFDTAVGGKKDARSYQAIAKAIDTLPANILFLSDVVEELAAARTAGFMVTHLIRDGDPASSDWPSAADFSAILPDEVLA